MAAVGSNRRPSLPPMPDLSHLTAEERQIIEAVLLRQREEEEKEQEILRNLQDDFENYEASVKKLNEEIQQKTSVTAAVAASGPLSGVAAVVGSAAAPSDTTQGAICEICHKTKFADGIGNQCHYCGLRSCSRCGSKVALRTDKPGVKETSSAIWTCQLCKKKQELLVKTGQWYHGSMAKPITLDIDVGSDASSTKTDSSSISDKRQTDQHQGQQQQLPHHQQQQQQQHHHHQQQHMGAGLPSASSLPGASSMMRYDNQHTGEGRQGMIEPNGAPIAGYGAYQRPMPAGPSATSRTPIIGSDAASSEYAVSQTPRLDLVNYSPQPTVNVDAAGRTIPDQSGRPLVDHGQLVDPSVSMRPYGDPSSSRPYIDQNGRQLVEQISSRTPNESGRQPMIHPGDMINSRSVNDPSVRPPVGPNDPSARSRQSALALDSSGRPLVAASEGRPIGEQPSRTEHVRPMGDADTSARPVVDLNTRRGVVPDMEGKLPPTDPSLLPQWRPDGNDPTLRSDDVNQRRSGTNRRPSGRGPQDDAGWQSREMDPTAKNATRPSRPLRSDPQWMGQEDG